MSIDLDNNLQVWEKRFQKGDWGRYPSEELVRFMGRNYKNCDRNKIKILEIGCGPGANLWFLHREGYQVSGIDGSPAAIQQATSRINIECGDIDNELDLKTGNFCQLPWKNSSFDVVVDVFAIYANTSEIISQVIHEAHRVLKDGGKLFTKLWGTKTTGFGTGTQLDAHTFDNITTGPCARFGISHFFDAQEIEKTFSMFEVESVDNILRSDAYSNSTIEEWNCVFRKRNL